jgi:hypothetical protein
LVDPPDKVYQSVIASRIPPRLSGSRRKNCVGLEERFS